MWTCTHMRLCGSLSKTLAQTHYYHTIWGCLLGNELFSLPQTLLRTRLLFCDLALRFLFSSRPLWLFNQISLAWKCWGGGTLNPYQNPIRWALGASQDLIPFCFIFKLLIDIHTEMYIYHIHMLQPDFHRLSSVYIGNQNIPEALFSTFHILSP